MQNSRLNHDVTASLSSAAVQDLHEALQEHHDRILTGHYIEEKAQQLHREGYVKIREILPESIMASLTLEVKQIIDKTARRIDLKIEATDYSPRKMKTVNYDNFMSEGYLVPFLYKSPALRSFLNTITGHPVENCPYIPERITATKQEKMGDTHGWHWGDHQYALIFIIEAPEIEAGGMLQCIPHTRWDKDHPRIHEIMTKNPINTYYHETGDIYFFRTDTTLHRTCPLQKDCTRIILNFTYSGPDDYHRPKKSYETTQAIYQF